MAELRQPLPSGPDPMEELPVDDYVPIFYVGHHESQRPLPISELTLRQAQDVGVCAYP